MTYCYMQCIPGTLYIQLRYAIIMGSKNIWLNVFLFFFLPVYSDCFGYNGQVSVWIWNGLASVISVMTMAGFFRAAYITVHKYD